MNQPTASIHITKALKAISTSQKLPKSMAAQTLLEKKMKKHGHTTKCINHWAISG